MDRPPAVADAAETLFHEAQADPALGRHVVHQPLAERAVEHGVGLRLVLERERKVEHDELLDRTYQLRWRHHRDFHRTALHCRGDLLLAAERAVRENLDLDLATAPLLNDVGHLLRAQRLWVVGRIDGRKLDVAFLDVGRRGRAGKEEHRGGKRHRSQYCLHGFPPG